MFTIAFVKASAERSVRAAAASLSSLLVADGTGLLGTDWADRLSVAGMAGVVSLLLSIAGGAVGAGVGPSFVGAETTTDAEHEVG